MPSASRDRDDALEALGAPASESPWAFGARTESAFNLALFRISVAAMVLLSPEIWTAAAWAQLPRALFVVPEGLGWFVAHVPITPAIARVASGLFVVGAITALVGWRARIGFTVVTIAGFYILALPQLAGSVNHNMHFLWFSALLAASPCADALSIDAWRAGRGWTSPVGPQYAWPIDVACLLFGAIYFFPGFWKLATSGLDWIWSDNLRNHMYWKWFESGWTPAFRIDQHPILCRLGAAGVVTFELAFPFLVLYRPSRPLAALSGIAFHLATELIVRIPFFGLWGLYIVLFDGRRIARWAGWKIADTPSPISARQQLPRTARLVGVVLLAGAFVQGARGAVQAWPFGCYPTFAWMVGTELPDIAVVAVGADGKERSIVQGARGSAEWALTWRVAGAYGPKASPEALRSYWELIARNPAIRAQAAGAQRIRLYSVTRSVIPEHRNQPPRNLSNLRPLAEFTLDAR